MVVGIAWIIIMTAICYIGIELSARTQQVLLGDGVHHADGVRRRRADQGLRQPSAALDRRRTLSWFNPFDISSISALNGGILLAVFIYWGWDSGVSVNEETEDSSTAPGRAAIISTFVLVAIYLLVTTAAQAFGGVDSLVNNSSRRVRAARQGRARLARSTRS